MGWSGIAAISALAASHASRFWCPGEEEEEEEEEHVRIRTSKKDRGYTYRFTPVPMYLGHHERHLSDVGDLLPLETVEIGLNRR